LRLRPLVVCWRCSWSDNTGSDAEATKRIQSGKMETKKRPIDSVAILKIALAAYHFPIRLEGLLNLQPAVISLKDNHDS
jgi:hypothetical protein